MRELRLKHRQDRNFPDAGAFARLGSKTKITRRIIEFCSAHAGYEDVVMFCEPIAKTQTAQSEPKRSIQLTEGFVYLLKSGRHFKIGRSNSAGRREYELAIQLPEKAIKIHEILTDDPAGIAAYWHNRFAAKRRGGEWFELTASDVNAFKRRKFM